MTRRMGLLVLLALAAGWLAYQTWSPQWQQKVAESNAIRRCKDIKPSEHLDLAGLRERHARCAAMEAAFQARW